MIKRRPRNVIASYGWLTSMALMLVVGCADAELSPVSGELRVNGKPATDAVLVFVPKDGFEKVGRYRPYAVVGSGGEFTVSTFEPNDGIPPGNYDITLYWRQNPRADHSPDRLRGRYGSLQSPLDTIEIHRGPNQLGPFDLSVPDLLPPDQKVPEQRIEP